MTAHEINMLLTRWQAVIGRQGPLRYTVRVTVEVA